MADLKPCPFCGGNAELVCTQTISSKGKIGGTFAVVCRGCGIRTKIYETEAELDTRSGDVKIKSNGAAHAIIDWNRRADDGK